VAIVGGRPWRIVVTPSIVGTDSSNARAHYTERLERAIHERLAALRR
jgi:hypothetical protein